MGCTKCTDVCKDRQKTPKKKSNTVLRIYMELCPMHK